MRSQFAKFTSPKDQAMEICQRSPLPFLPARRRLDDPIFQPLENLRPICAQPVQNVLRQSPIMRPGLDNLPSLASVFRIWHFLEPFGELKGQQLAKEAANAHA